MYECAVNGPNPSHTAVLKENGGKLKQFVDVIGEKAL